MAKNEMRNPAIDTDSEMTEMLERVNKNWKYFKCASPLIGQHECNELNRSQQKEPKGTSRDFFKTATFEMK